MSLISTIPSTWAQAPHSCRPQNTRGYGSTPEEYDACIESLRESEFPQLRYTTYLDHAGTTLSPNTLLTNFAHDLQTHLFGNPHSVSPSSHLTSTRIDAARLAVLRYFSASPEEFDVVFTANATAGIKVVRDAVFAAEGGYVLGYHRDCHTSIVGLREAARGVRYFESDQAVEAWIRSGAEMGFGENHVGGNREGDRLGDAEVEDEDQTNCPIKLFAYPAQSNLSGHRCPLIWPGKIRAASSSTTSTAISRKHDNAESQVYTLLDAASYLTSSRLNLSDAAIAPDFVCCSFYKIFGFPDLGALIVNKVTGGAGLLARGRMGTQARKTERGGRTQCGGNLRGTRGGGGYFGGGTVEMIINSTRREGEWVAMRVLAYPASYPSLTPSPLSLKPKTLLHLDIHELFEDGTLPFHSIIALTHAIPLHEKLFGGPARIRAHTGRLAKMMYDGLAALRYKDGRSVVQVHTDPSPPSNKNNNSNGKNYADSRERLPFGNTEVQGPIVTFSLLSPSSPQRIPKTVVSRAAIACGIQFRAGGMCNPGGTAHYLDLQPWEMRRNYMMGMRCGDDKDIVAGKATGVVRASLGAMSTERDVRRCVDWVRWWFVGEEGGYLAGWEIKGLGLEVEDEEEVTRLKVIDGLPPAEVVWRSEPDLPSLSALHSQQRGASKTQRKRKATHEALSVWEKGWVITSLEPKTTGWPVAKEVLERAKRSLKVRLMPEDGLLTFSSVEKEGNAVEEVQLSLWDLPPQPPSCSSCSSFYSDESTSTSTVPQRRKAATPYLSQHITAFFSATLGQPCTIARHPTPQITQAVANEKWKWRCVKMGCHRLCMSEKESQRHLALHAGEFERWWEGQEQERGGTSHKHIWHSMLESLIDGGKHRSKIKGEGVTGSFGTPYWIF